MKILVFSLDEKGFSEVKALTESTGGGEIFCVTGQDDGVDDDYSSKLSTFCDQHKIGYFLSRDATYSVADY